MKKYRVILRDVLGMTHHVLIDSNNIDESLDKMLKSTKVLIDGTKNRYLVIDKIINIEWKEEA